MTTPTPWWENDPTLAEIRRRMAAEFGTRPDAVHPGDTSAHDLDDLDDFDDPDCPAGPAEPDPVTTDMWSGRCRRELSEARNALRDASNRYDAAVLAARTAGLSWAEIGTVLGVAKQQLHRRFRTRQRGRP